MYNFVREIYLSFKINGSKNILTRVGFYSNSHNCWYIVHSPVYLNTSPSYHLTSQQYFYQSKHFGR